MHLLFFKYLKMKFIKISKFIVFIFVISSFFWLTNSKIFIKNQKSQPLKNHYGVSHDQTDNVKKALEKLPIKYRHRMHIVSICPSEIMSRKKEIHCFNYVYKKYPILYVISSNANNKLPEFILFDIHPTAQKFYLEIYGDTYQQLVKDYKDELSKMFIEMRNDKI